MSSFYAHSPSVNCSFALLKALGWKDKSMTGKRQMTQFNKPRVLLIKYFMVEFI